jgi:hypothetical protein
MQIQSQGSKTQVCSPIGSKGAAGVVEAGVVGLLEGEERRVRSLEFEPERSGDSRRANLSKKIRRHVGPVVFGDVGIVLLLGLAHRSKRKVSAKTSAALATEWRV